MVLAGRGGYTPNPLKHFSWHFLKTQSSAKETKVTVCESRDLVVLLTASPIGGNWCPFFYQGINHGCSRSSAYLEFPSAGQYFHHKFQVQGRSKFPGLRQRRMIQLQVQGCLQTFGRGLCCSSTSFVDAVAAFVAMTDPCLL